MTQLTKAVYELLSNDPTLATLLAEYNGKPAIFTVQPIPKDCQMPVIITTGNISDIDVGGKGGKEIREVTRDIRCYDNTTGSAIRIETIAERVRELIHRRPTALTITGWTCKIAEVQGAMALDEADAYGRIVSVRLTIEEN